MAPELLQQPSPPPAAAPTTTTPSSSAQAAYDARAADAWALGVLLFLLLAGAYPFEDERHPSSVAHTVANVLAGRRRAWPEWVSEKGRRVVEGLLRSDAAARTTLRELATDSWLAQGARRYASGVPGGPALVNLSSVASVVPAVMVEAAVPAKEEQEEQQQEEQGPPAPPAPASQPPKQGLLQRLMAGLRVK
jgi:serine/threonine protein kinase